MFWNYIMFLHYTPVITISNLEVACVLPHELMFCVKVASCFYSLMHNLFLAVISERLI